MFIIVWICLIHCHTLAALLPFRSQLINFLKKSYTILNASYQGICVRFERKNITLVFLLLNGPKVLFYNRPVKYYFWQFRYMITRLYDVQFSCLYIHRGHYFISYLWLWSTDEYVLVWCWVKVHLECFL